MMNISKSGAALALASFLGLAACGTTTGDRALSGGLIGAGGGAAIGAMTGNPAAGAAIGGAAGAVAGAATTPDEVNLGDPVWRREHHCVDYDRDGNCLRWRHN